jgi:hypothetical protein
MLNNIYRKHVEPIIFFSSILALGFLVSVILTVYIGFILNRPISNWSLPISFVVYIFVVSIFLFLHKLNKQVRNGLIGLVLFVVFSLFILYISKTVFSKTYDTSWDGQGYHSSGVINLSNGWNPIYHANLPIKIPDGAIFVQGYPKGLWILQSSLYSMSHNINAAKVFNLAILFIAFALVYSFIRKFKISVFFTILLTFLICVQLHYIIQLFSFMEDGFCYEVLLCAISTLCIFAIDTSYLSLYGFLFSELILVGTKFNNLPPSLILAVICAYMIMKKVFNQKLYIDKQFKLFVFSSIAVSILFLWIPYATNIAFFHHPFYPTNLADVNITYTIQNVPKNVDSKNKFALLFYGIFSRSQTDASGMRQSPFNVAVLKLPFTYTEDEINLSTETHNNRVGSAGPLFSGIFTLSLLVGAVLISFFYNKQKKCVYYSVGTVLLIILSVLITPAPNLLRYNGQIVLIPFIIIIMALKGAKYRKVLYLPIIILIALMCTNLLLFSIPILKESAVIMPATINNQLNQMKQSKKIYYINAKIFYSNYIRLQEYGVNFKIVDKLTCKKPQLLLNSSYTTWFCSNN